MIYDVSNACLGMLNGMLQIANMIELGQIQAGLVVGCESGRALVETTIERLTATTRYAEANQDGRRVADHRLGQFRRSCWSTNRGLARHGVAYGVTGTATAHHRFAKAVKTKRWPTACNR